MLERGEIVNSALFCQQMFLTIFFQHPMNLLPMAEKSFVKALWCRLDVFVIILPTTHQLGSQVL
jgi:hypothetical protein